MDHLGIDTTTARRAIITGDPARVAEIATHLGDGEVLTERRGLICRAARDAGGGELLVVATGIGAPATAIVVEELAELGVRTIVRLGSCGGVRPGLRPNDLVVATGGVRDEGTSTQYIEPSFPAVPDLTLTAALLAELRREGGRPHAGIVHCKDAYYLEHADRQLLPEATALRWRALRDAGVVATEMESSLLFVLGSLRRLRTASLLVAVGREADPRGFSTALGGAVGAVSRVFAELGEEAADARPARTRSSFLEEGAE